MISSLIQSAWDPSWEYAPLKWAATSHGELVLTTRIIGVQMERLLPAFCSGTWFFPLLSVHHLAILWFFFLCSKCVAKEAICFSCSTDYQSMCKCADRLSRVRVLLSWSQTTWLHLIFGTNTLIGKSNAKSMDGLLLRFLQACYSPFPFIGSFECTFLVLIKNIKNSSKFLSTEKFSCREK